MVVPSGLQRVLKLNFTLSIPLKDLPVTLLRARTRVRGICLDSLRGPKRAWSPPERYTEEFNGSFDEGREQDLIVFDTDPWRKINGALSHG